MKIQIYGAVSWWMVMLVVTVYVFRFSSTKRRVMDAVVDGAEWGSISVAPILCKMLVKMRNAAAWNWSIPIIQWVLG